MARRRKKKKGIGDAASGAILTTVGLVILTSLAAGALWLRSTKIPLDDDTNCPLAGPQAIHVVIFDRSDPISGQQGQRVRQQLTSLRDAAVFGERFDLYAFEGDSEAVLQPILRLCSPGRPEEANELIENPQRIRQRYEERFSSVLDRTIDELLANSTRPSSPILESIRAAAVTSFGPVETEAVPLRVTLISDMIQHSNLLSHYRDAPHFTALAAHPVWASVRPNLKGARVEILYLLRMSAQFQTAPIQNRGHQYFWEELITASGGRLDSIEPI